METKEIGVVTNLVLAMLENDHDVIRMASGQLFLLHNGVSIVVNIETVEQLIITTKSGTLSYPDKAVPKRAPKKKESNQTALNSKIVKALNRSTTVIIKKTILFLKMDKDVELESGKPLLKMLKPELVKCMGVLCGQPKFEDKSDLIIDAINAMTEKLKTP